MAEFGPAYRRRVRGFVLGAMGAPGSHIQNAWSQEMLRRIAELISPTML